MRNDQELVTKELSEAIVGGKISRIFINEDYLCFSLIEPCKNVWFSVDGDCCSNSYFHDFVGVKNLLKGGKILSLEPVAMDHRDVERVSDDESVSDDVFVQFYGYRITVEDENFDTLSAVVAFRNESNGYYGGEMFLVKARTAIPCEKDELPEIFEDYFGD
jgi:hypothetical protein